MPIEEEETERHFYWQPSCSDLYGFINLCRSARMQAKFYHRHGRFDDCTQFTKEWRACMKTKFMKTDEAQAFYEEYKREQQANAPKPVWELRAPGDLPPIFQSAAAPTGSSSSS